MTERINPTILRRVIQAGKVMVQRDRARSMGFKAGDVSADGTPSAYSKVVLGGLQSRPSGNAWGNRQVFAGLDPQHPTKSTTKALAKRRTRNKAARKSRARNR